MRLPQGDQVSLTQSTVFEMVPERLSGNPVTNLQRLFGYYVFPDCLESLRKEHHCPHSVDWSDEYKCILGLDKEWTERGIGSKDQVKVQLVELLQRLDPQTYVYIITHLDAKATQIPDSMRGSKDVETIDLFQHYQLEKEIGSGGSAIVCKAFDVQLQRNVAIKFFCPMNDGDDDSFISEMQHQAGVYIPGVISPFRIAKIAIPKCSTPIELGVFRPQDATKRRWTGLIAVLPLVVKASTLADLICDWRKLNPTRPDWDEFRSIVQQILFSMKQVHASNRVHLDLKPVNILIEKLPGGIGLRTHIIDFLVPGKSTIVAGTPGYQSPEQRISARAVYGSKPSDIYSIGLLIFRMLTEASCVDQLDKSEASRSRSLSTEHPTTATEFDDSSTKQNSEDSFTKPLHSLKPDLRNLDQFSNQVDPTDLKSILGKCLEIDRINRYQDAGQLYDDFERLFALKPLEHAGSRTVGHKLRLFVRRESAFAKSTVIVLSLLLVLASVFAYNAYRVNSIATDSLLAQADRAVLRGDHMEAASFNSAALQLMPYLLQSTTNAESIKRRVYSQLFTRPHLELASVPPEMPGNVLSTKHSNNNRIFVLTNVGWSIHNLEDGQVVNEGKHTFVATSSDFADDGSAFAIGSNEGLFVGQENDGEFVTHLIKSSGGTTAMDSIDAIRFSPVKKLIAYVSSDGMDAKLHFVDVSDSSKPLLYPHSIPIITASQSSKGFIRFDETGKELVVIAGKDLVSFISSREIDPFNESGNWARRNHTFDETIEKVEILGSRLLVGLRSRTSVLIADEEKFQQKNIEMRLMDVSEKVSVDGNSSALFTSIDGKETYSVVLDYRLKVLKNELIPNLLEVNDSAISKDGRFFLATEENGLSLWDFQSLVPLMNFVPHEGPPNFFSFFTKDRVFSIVNKYPEFRSDLRNVFGSHTVYLWDLKSKDSIQDLGIENANSAAFSGDGRSIAVSACNSLWPIVNDVPPHIAIYDSNGRLVKWRETEAAIANLAFSNSGSILGSSSLDPSPKVLLMDGNLEVVDSKIFPESDGVHCSINKGIIIFSTPWPIGRKLSIVGIRSNSIQEIASRVPIGVLDWAVNDDFLIHAARDENELYLRRIDNLDNVQLTVGLPALVKPEKPIRIAITKTHLFLASGTQIASMAIPSKSTTLSAESIIQTGREIQEIKGVGKCVAIRSRRSIYIGNTDSRAVNWIDLPNSTLGFEFSANGERLWVMCKENLYCFNSDARPLCSFALRGSMEQIAVSPDGTKCVAISSGIAYLLTIADSNLPSSIPELVKTVERISGMMYSDGVLRKTTPDR